LFLSRQCSKYGTLKEKIWRPTGAQSAEDADYEGVQVTFVAYLQRAKIPIQIDIGIRAGRMGFDTGETGSTSEVGWIDSTGGRNSNWSFVVPR
jgi:hypothetical protein